MADGTISATTVVQSAWRRTVAQRAYEDTRRRRAAAVVMLVRWWRRLWHMERQEVAALMVQRIQRGHRDRKAQSMQEAILFRADDFGMQIVPNSIAMCSVVAHDPLVTVTDGFLSSAECEALIACAAAWRRSGVSMEVIGRDRTSAGRTSTTAVENPALTSALAPLRQRLALMFGVLISQFEASQVLHYDKGGAYRWHYDAYDQTTAKGVRYTRRRGQRLATAICYLNTVEGGGETAFFYHRRAVAPRVGRLLTFRNVAMADHGALVLNPRSFHAGLPVLCGGKWIVTTFLRER